MPKPDSLQGSLDLLRHRMDYMNLSRDSNGAGAPKKNFRMLFYGEKAEYPKAHRSVTVAAKNAVLASTQVLSAVADSVFIFQDGRRPYVVHRWLIDLAALVLPELRTQSLRTPT